VRAWLIRGERDSAGYSKYSFFQEVICATYHTFARELDSLD